MSKTREKIATQMDSALLAELRALAKLEGRQIQVLIEEAVSGLLEDRKQARARPHVMAAYRASHDRFADVYQKLAK